MEGTTFDCQHENELQDMPEDRQPISITDELWARLEMEKAIQLKRANNFEKSIEIYKNVIDQLPKLDIAYKQMAKVQIAAGQFEDAIRSTLMKIDLGICCTKQCDTRTFLGIKGVAMTNISTPQFTLPVDFGSNSIGHGEIFKMCVNDELSSDVALLAYAEDDLYYYLGHCLVRMFPDAFAKYQIPEYLLSNFENAIAGRISLPDARDSSYAHVFYVSGYMFARRNIPQVLSSLNPIALKKRYNREIDFLGLSDEFRRISEEECARIRIVNFLNALTEMIRSKFACQTLSPEFISGEKWRCGDSTEIGIIEYVRMDNRLSVDQFEELLRTKRVYICAIHVRIDSESPNDNLVSLTYGNWSDWDLEAWIEENFHFNVLSMGIKRDEARNPYRCFRFILWELKR